MLFAPSFTAADAARLRRVERKLDALLAHLGVAVPAESADDRLADMRALADRGEKIAAIKAYRDATGARLAEAKRAVEAYLSGPSGRA